MTFLITLLNQLQAVFAQKFYIKFFIILYLLLVFGAIPDGGLLALLLLFVVFSTLKLVHQGFRTVPDWDAVYRELLDYYHQLSAEELSEEAEQLNINANSSVEQIAEKVFNELKSETLAPRPWPELVSEILGVVSLVLLLPINFCLYSQTFVSPREGFSYIGYGIVLVCIAIYFLSNKYIKSVRLKKACYLILFVVTMSFGGLQVSENHNYLNPFNPEKVRLRAEKILSLNDNVEAASHWSWLFAYASLQQEQGNIIEATQLFAHILTLVPNNIEVRKRLTALQNPSEVPFDVEKYQAEARQYAFAPLWQENQKVRHLSPCAIDSRLLQRKHSTIVIVPVGDVAEETIDIVGHVLRKELDIATCVSNKAIPLPDYSRFRGLVFGKQWHANALIKAFQQTFNVSVPYPVFYLLITNKDIYSDSSNFVFSFSYAWGAVLSNKRFDDGNNTRLMQRTAKQALGAMAKVLGATASPDPYCVTSYTSNMNEFDAKGNRPSLQTKAVINQFVEQRDREWQRVNSF